VLRLVGQLFHFFAIMLWVAAALALVAGLPQLSVAIAAVVVVNGAFAFAQERRAERAADQMQDLIPRRVVVLRDGVRKETDAVDLVVGDVVSLGAGDRVPADLEVLVAHSLRVDTSLITGESAPQDVTTGQPMVGGSFVTEGETLATVTAVGPRTRLAGIAELTRSTVRPQSPLVHEMNRVVRTISVIALSVGGGFFLVSLVTGLDPRDGFLFAIGVSVALVPEALLPTVTLSLALGAQRMARRHAVVRHLESVETLGSVTFICTDKTGTLTRNQMQVVEAWTPDGSVRIEGAGYEPTAEVVGSTAAVSSVTSLAAQALACSNGRAVLDGGSWVSLGDPMEAAIDCLARRLDAPAAPGRLGSRFPFDPRRRRMSVVVGDQVLVKGAPDAVLGLCDDRGTKGAAEAAAALTERGLRVLAVAERACPGRPPTSATAAETELTLVGLLGFEDPARPEVAQAIDTSRRSGIKVAMVTGDHPATAVGVAREVGLQVPGAPVLVGDDLPDDELALGELLDHDGVVVARVSPEQKLLIARALQLRGHVVAMTGDGVNDGPALQEADIGVAMGRFGSDVAREASDLVLLDDDFATIVAAIEQGRGTFLNVRRFLTYHLTDNVAELFPLVVWALSGTRFPLALGVLQILALDLATDTLSAVALGAEQPHGHVMRRPPVSGRLLNSVVAWRAFGLLGPAEALTAMLGFLAVMLVGGWTPGSGTPEAELLAAASGAYFLTVVAAQAGNAFACRSSTLRPGQLGWTSNPLLLGAVAVDVTVAVLMVVVPPVADLLGQAVPTTVGWAVVLAGAPVLLLLDAADKALIRRWMGGRARAPGPTSA
jgi:calcium-translocating P-type ATPase